MTSEVEIHGHQIELFDIQPGETCTDVIILTRTISHDEDGDLQDALQCVSTKNSTALIRVGMLKMASQMEVTGWQDREEY
ncbi:hypothetical protein [Glutamicibacter protophormiae]|uniref:hypothetical protein n=1 Tax=Glutamicibacter protophormiae TaxID=37930 RepID=UPI003A928C5A